MNKTKIYNLLDLCLWIVNPFLIVLVVFDEKILPGIFLQWFGKMHPLALHFPVVFGILIGIYFVFFQKQRFSIEIEKLLLAINALFASAVVLFGILLAKHGAYEGEIFDLHKWGGIALAFFSWLFLFILKANRHFLKLISILFLALLIGATHKGAQLTHGVDALSFPKIKDSDKEKIDLADTTITVFESGVAPILNQKCVSCHGVEKVKGDLRLDSPEQILRGGESGDILIAGSSSESIFLELIHLPLENKDHMPPDGKLQLTKDEIALLRNWIKRESNFELRINELAEEDSLLILTNKYVAANKEVTIQTNLPDLAEFNTDYCSVNYLFYGSDKVEVNFFQASFYKPETLKKLLQINGSIVKLNMQNMPLEKEDLDIILQFENLQKVNLNSTQLDIVALHALKSLDKLQEVSICGIDFDEAELDQFLSEARFNAVNIWTDKVNGSQLEKLSEKYTQIQFTIGDNLKDEVLKINSPVIDQDSSIYKNNLEIKIKHLLNGVDIFYTINEEEPDSLSLKYTEPLMISENTILKTKAYKRGWVSSDVVQQTFYKSGVKPDTIFLLTAPNPKYRGNGARTLANYELGGTNKSNGEWLGYQDANLEFVLGFKNEKVLPSLTVSAMTDIRGHIFPPKSITVFGSIDGMEYLKVGKVDFPDASKRDPKKANLFTCVIDQEKAFKYYKVEVANLKKIPPWHKGKGKPAWVFVDEVFLN